MAHLAGLVDDVHRIVEEVVEHAGRHCYAASNGRQQGYLGAQECMQAPSAPNLYAHLALAVSYRETKDRTLYARKHGVKQMSPRMHDSGISGHYPCAQVHQDTGRCQVDQPCHLNICCSLLHQHLSVSVEASWQPNPVLAVTHATARIAAWRRPAVDALA